MHAKASHLRNVESAIQAISCYLRFQNCIQILCDTFFGINKICNLRIANFATGKASQCLRLVIGLLLASCGLTGSALAQSGRVISVPSDQPVVSAGGVDLNSGRFNYKQEDLTVGDGDGGLSFVRTMPYLTDMQAALGNFTSNWDVWISIGRFSISARQTDGGWPNGSDYVAMVNDGSRILTFIGSQSSNGYGLETRGPIAFLTFTGTQGTSSVIYTYRTEDGTAITFQPLGIVDGVAVTGIYPTKLVRADGTTFTFDYAAYAGASGNLARTRSISSSRGFALFMEGSGGLTTKVCALNITQTVLPANYLCPSGALASASYIYSGNNLSSVTDARGALSQFVYGTSGGDSSIGFIKPGQSTPWLTNLFRTSTDEMGHTYSVVSSQSFVNGQSITYTPHFPPPMSGSFSISGSRATNALGEVEDVDSGFYRQPLPTCYIRPCPPRTPENMIPYRQTPGPIYITRSGAHTTTFNYCDPVNATFCNPSDLQYFIDPNGIKTIVTYEGRNITQATTMPKSGSGLPPINRAATFDCTYLINCAKPSSSTDANGKVVNFTYDPTHGGILTKSDPADAAGIRPVKRYAYVQRYAWISDGAGGYIHGSSPMWLLLSEKTCRTSATVGAACGAGPADEVVTTYDYGPDSGPNNLLLRGMTVTADGSMLRTCYQYDGRGNRISETKPAAGLAVCS